MISEGKQVIASADKPTTKTEFDSEELPVAMLPGKLSTVEGKYLCYVLDNGKRVIRQREVVRALTKQSKSGLERYLESQNLKAIISSKKVAD